MIPDRRSDGPATAARTAHPGLALLTVTLVWAVSVIDERITTARDAVVTETA